MKKGTRIMAALLSAFLMSSLFGCQGKPEEENTPISGGNTHREDPDAPKTITSDEITELHASFWLNHRMDADEDHKFVFEIKKDDNGSFVLHEETNDITTEISETELKEVQNVIRQYDLPKQNGLYDVTAGLPPEFQPGGLDVLYASGEKLSFTTDNDPDALWAEDLYDVFAGCFAENGITALYPQKEDSVLARFSFIIKEDGLLYDYGGIHVSEENAIDGETYLLEKSIYDEAQQKEILTSQILFPESYYETLTDIISQSDLLFNYELSEFNYDSGSYDNHGLGFYGMGAKRPDHTEEDTEDLYIDLYLEYESGRRFNIETRKRSEIEGMRTILQNIREYLDSLY